MLPEYDKRAKREPPPLPIHPSDQRLTSAMTKRATTFVHLTDLHLKADDAIDPSLLTDTAAALRRSISEIHRMDPMPDFIVMSGDLTNAGDAAAYATLKTFLAELPLSVPVLLALGNHDSRTGFVETFPHLHSDPHLPYCHDRVIEDLHVITLDSSVPGLISGVLSDDQIDWLAGRLNTHADLHKLIVVHHPPLLDSAHDGEAWHSLDWSSTQALLKVLQGHRIAGILSGHVHLNCMIHWHGMPVIIGAGHHAAADPLAPPEIIRLIDSAGFAVCTLQPSGLAATFIAHPQTGAVLHSITTDSIRSREVASRAEAVADKTI